MLFHNNSQPLDMSGHNPLHQYVQGSVHLTDRVRVRRSLDQDTLILHKRAFEIFICVIYFVVGFVPILAIACEVFGFVSLPVTSEIVVVPALALGLGTSFAFPAYGRRALKGLIIGILAVLCYDCLRIPLALTGIWGDFIPRIGVWLLPFAHPRWIDYVIGYTWRYLGDGGGMGMAFAVTYSLLFPRLHPLVASLIFVCGVWSSLIMTILLAPHGQEMLFALTPTILVLSLLGHLIYGTVLGVLCKRAHTHAALSLSFPAMPFNLRR